jgi:hypothetical protein
LGRHRLAINARNLRYQRLSLRRRNRFWRSAWHGALIDRGWSCGHLRKGDLRGLRDLRLGRVVWTLDPENRTVRGLNSVNGHYSLPKTRKPEGIAVGAAPGVTAC